jgi:hypothetical protein
MEKILNEILITLNTLHEDVIDLKQELSITHFKAIP